MAEEGRRVEKVWGVESYITNHSRFCAKELQVYPWKVCSNHKHEWKDEFFKVMSGIGFIEVDSEIHFVEPDDYVHVPRGSWHRFWSLTGMTLLEISSHHSDLDVIRDGESGVIHTSHKETNRK